MTFLEHLDELRSRLFRVAIVFVVLLAAVGSSATVSSRSPRADSRAPLGGGEIIFITLTEPFMVYMKASAIAALFLSSPYILCSLGFVAPGL